MKVNDDRLRRLKDKCSETLDILLDDIVNDDNETPSLIDWLDCQPDYEVTIGPDGDFRYGVVTLVCEEQGNLMITIDTRDGLMKGKWYDTEYEAPVNQRLVDAVIAAFREYIGQISITPELSFTPEMADDLPKLDLDDQGGGPMVH